MKKILITRPMPQPVIDRASKLGNIVVRPETTPLVQQEMISALQEYDIIVPTLRDCFSAEIFLQVNKPRCKLLANFALFFFALNLFIKSVVCLTNFS